MNRAKIKKMTKNNELQKPLLIISYHLMGAPMGVCYDRSDVKRQLSI